jgi:hypothetical protein
MFRRLGTFPLAIVVAFATSVPTTGNADPSGMLRADLEGRPITLRSVAQFYCHDFDWPEIHCFTTSIQLEAAVVDRIGATGPTSTASVQSATAVSYIRVFDLSWYAGGYIYLSADYANLGVIGWNDRISSYNGTNSEDSALYVNTSYAGSTLLVCCNNKAATLSPTFDNQISSTKRW